MESVLAALVRYDVAFATVALYLTYALTHWHHRSAPLDRRLIALHSLLIYVCSFALLSVLIFALSRAYTHVGRTWMERVHALSCTSQTLDGDPTFDLIYRVNVLFKYWELFDTVILVYSPSSLSFLHVFHHAASFLMVPKVLGRV